MTIVVTRGVAFAAHSSPHETGHTLYSSGIAKVPELSSRVQVWYDCAINGTKGAYHPDINTRAELQKEMPDFYQFLSELLPADNKYEDCYSKP
jgi:hypothetical protein